MRKTKEDAAATRKALLDAALTVFSRQGYAATRLEDVAKEAGVTRGAIYWHFGSKAELYNTMVSEISVGVEDMVNRVIAMGGTFTEICRRIMIRLLEYLEEDETYRAMQELVLLKTELLPELMEGVKLKTEATNMLVERLTMYFSASIKAGEVRATLDPRIGALGMITCLNGIALTWLLDQQAFSLREYAPELVEIFIQGIAAHP